MEDDLQQDIPQLFFHVGNVLFADRGFEFMGFLKEVFQQRLVGLLALQPQQTGQCRERERVELFGEEQTRLPEPVEAGTEMLICLF